MAKVVFYQCEKSTKTATPYAEFDTDVIGKSEYDNKCREIQAKFGAEYTRAFEVTTTPPSGIPAHQGAQTGQLNDGQTVQLVYYLVYTNANAFNLANPVQEAEYFDYLEKNGMKSKKAALADLNKNYSTLSEEEKNNIAARYEMHLQQINAGANMGQGIGANTTGITYGEVRKAIAGTKGRKGAVAAIQLLRPGMSQDQAENIWKKTLLQRWKYKGTSQDYDAVLTKGDDVTRLASYSYDVGEKATPQKNGYSFTLGTIGQLAREATGINPRSEDFREMIAARFGVGPREAGYYQRQYLDQTPDMAEALKDPVFQSAPENIVGYNAALQELPQRGQFDLSNVPLKRKAFEFDKDQEIWDELKKSGLAGGGVGKRAMQILQQLIRTAPGASQSYIIEQARKFDPNIGEQSFRTRFNAVRDASIERGLFVDNDEAGQRIVDAHLRAQELAGKSDEEKIALYNQLEESGQISAFKPRKASLFERYNRFSGYNRKRNELKSEYDKVEAERKQAEADYAKATSPDDKKKFKEQSEQAEKRLGEINADLNMIKEGYADWLTNTEKLKLINDQIIKTLEQTSEAIDPGTGKVKDPNYRFDADVQKTIDSSGKDSTIVEGAAERRRKSSDEERVSQYSDDLKAHIESVRQRNEARENSWGQRGARWGHTIGGTAGGNIGSQLGRSAAQVVGAFTNLIPVVGKLTTGFKTLSSTMEESVQKMLYMSMYNGTLLATNIQHIGREFRRNLWFAQATSESGSRLIDSYDKLQDAQQPLRIEWQNLKNNLGSGFADILTSALKGVNAAGRWTGFFHQDHYFEDTVTTGMGTGKTTKEDVLGDDGGYDVNKGDYTAYQEDENLTEEDKKRNKKIAREMAKKEVSELEAWGAFFSQDVRGDRTGKDAHFHWSTGDTALDIAQGDEHFQEMVAAEQMRQKRYYDVLEGRSAGTAERTALEKRLDEEAGLVNGVATTKEARKRLMAAREAVEKGKIFAETKEAIDFTKNVDSEDDAFDFKGLSAKAGTLVKQGELLQKYWDSGDKHEVDKELLKEVYGSDSEATVAAFRKIADDKSKRKDNEYVVAVSDMKQGEVWQGYQALEQPKSLKQLEDILAAMEKGQILTQLTNERLAEIAGSNDAIARNTSTSTSEQTSDLLMNMMGEIALQATTDHSVPQGVDVSSFNNENKQYGRFAGQRKTTYWGRLEE